MHFHFLVAYLCAVLDCNGFKTGVVFIVYFRVILCWWNFWWTWAVACQKIPTRQTAIFFISWLGSACSSGCPKSSWLFMYVSLCCFMPTRLFFPLHIMPLASGALLILWTCTLCTSTGQPKEMERFAYNTSYVRTCTVLVQSSAAISQHVFWC